MDSILIEIYKIKDLEYIKIYDLISQTKANLMLVPCILINYDGGKILNLSVKDKYFKIYLKKIKEVLEDEKDYKKPDSPFVKEKNRTKIEMDLKTKEILENGSLENRKDIYDFYKNKLTYQDSLLFNQDEMNLLLPILKYHVKKFFEKTNKVINFSNDKILGYRNNFIIPALVDGLSLDLLLTYNKTNDNKYEFELGGILKNNISVKVEIEFKKTDLLVQVSIFDYNLFDTFNYQTLDNQVKVKNETLKDDRIVYYQEELLKETLNQFPNITNLEQENNLRYFQLPWKAIIGINTKVVDISSCEQIKSYTSMYLDFIEDSFFKKEYFAKVYKKEANQDDVLGNLMVLDEFSKNTRGVLISKSAKLYIIETLFLETLSPSGYYKEKLENKYFYHLTVSKDGIKKITKQELKPIKSEDDILFSSDLLNQDKVLKIVGGK